ncbi:hypothetical protein Nmel_002545 [Mimus melanotis]
MRCSRVPRKKLCSEPMHRTGAFSSGFDTLQQKVPGTLHGTKAKQEMAEQPKLLHRSLTPKLLHLGRILTKQEGFVDKYPTRVKSTNNEYGKEVLKG